VAECFKSWRHRAVLSLMADDVVFLVAGQPPMRGKAAFAAGQSKLKRLDIEATSNIQEITVLGDWAYVWTELSVVMTPKEWCSAHQARRYTALSSAQKDGAW